MVEVLTVLIALKHPEQVLDCDHRMYNCGYDSIDETVQDLPHEPDYAEAHPFARIHEVHRVPIIYLDYSA
jgi:hypothetical protein